MKIESIGKAPSNAPIINLRVGAKELEILRGLLVNGVKYTPRTEETEKTFQRMKCMLKCLHIHQINEWLEWEKKNNPE